MPLKFFSLCCLCNSLKPRQKSPSSRVHACMSSVTWEMLSSGQWITLVGEGASLMQAPAPLLKSVNILPCFQLITRDQIPFCCQMRVQNEWIWDFAQSSPSLLCGECFLPLKYLSPEEFIRSYICFQHNRVLNFIHMLLFLIKAFGLAVGVWSLVEQGGSVTGESCSSSFGEGLFRGSRNLLSGSYTSSCPCGAAFCQAEHCRCENSRQILLQRALWIQESELLKATELGLERSCFR